MHKLWRRPDGTPFFCGDMRLLEAEVQKTSGWRGWITGSTRDVFQLAGNAGLHCFKRGSIYTSFDLRPQTGEAKVFEVKNESGNLEQIEALLTQLGLVPVEETERS